MAIMSGTRSCEDSGRIGPTSIGESHEDASLGAQWRGACCITGPISLDVRGFRWPAPEHDQGQRNILKIDEIDRWPQHAPRHHGQGGQIRGRSRSLVRNAGRESVRVLRRAGS